MIALIDYGAGNLRSVQNALGRLDATCTIASDPEDVARAQAIIFPGVGAAAPAMAALRDRGLDQAVTAAIRNGMPFLGICLGMQLLFESSAEDGAACLGVIPGTVERLKTQEKLPHVGWNTLERVRPHRVLEAMDGEAFYFVHSYVVVPRYPVVTAGTTTYGVPFVSAVTLESLVGVQFHPERSGTAGLRLLENFLRFADAEAAA
jgi:imidazole glycerol-phosphate synthase subunit HisH